jgi:hypothetical protein
MSSKRDVVPPKPKLRSAIRKLILASGFARCEKPVVDEIVERVQKDLQRLGKASYLKSKYSSIHEDDVVAAAKALGYGNVEVAASIFNSARRHHRRAPKSAEETT